MTHPPSLLTRTLAADGAVRVLAVECSQVAETLRRRHQLDAKVSALVGEGVAATALLSAHIKGPEKVTLQVRIEAPTQAMFLGEIDADGRFRGRATPTVASLAADTRLAGLMLATKHDGTKEVYRGIGALDGPFGPSFGQYLGESNQVDAYVRIGVRVRGDGTLGFAGGLLVERLPEAPGQPSLDREAFQQRFSAVLTEDPYDLHVAFALGTVLGDPVVVLDQRPLVYQCACTRERMHNALLGLGPAELHDMLAEDGGAVVTCHFCNERYELGPTALAGLLELAREAQSVGE